MPLTVEEISALLAKDKKRHLALNPPQVGPLRRHDKEVRCAKRGCLVMTCYTVQGVPYCSIHALEEMNEMLVAQGFRGIVTRVVMHPTQLPLGRLVSASTRARLDVGWSLGKFDCIHGINLLKDCDYCDSGSSN